MRNNSSSAAATQSPSRRPRDGDITAGAQLWVDTVESQLRDARRIAQQSSADVMSFKERTVDAAKAREQQLLEYAHLKRIEDNCYGGKRVIPRVGDTTTATNAAVVPMSNSVDGGEQHHRCGGGGGGSLSHPCGCVKEHHLPQLPLSARGVEAAKYRVKLQAEKKRLKEEAILQAREQEKQLRRERLLAAKRAFGEGTANSKKRKHTGEWEGGEDGRTKEEIEAEEEEMRRLAPRHHRRNLCVSDDNVVALQSKDGEHDGAADSGANRTISTTTARGGVFSERHGMAATTHSCTTAPSPRKSGGATLDSEKIQRQTAANNSPRGIHPNNNAPSAPSSTTAAAAFVITDQMLATSGLPPDLLRSGTAAAQNMTAVAQLLLLTRQRLAIIAEERVAPAAKAIRRCFDTRRTHTPANEQGYHDAVEKAFLAAIDGTEKHSAAIIAEKTKVEDLVAYVDGLRKVITSRLPKGAAAAAMGINPIVNGGSVGATTLATATPKLPQVTAEQPIPSATMNLVALATGKRRRIPLYDVEGAVRCAAEAYQEGLATNDAAQHVCRYVKKDLRSLLDQCCAALADKIRANKSLQRALATEIGQLEVKEKELTNFLNQQKKKGGGGTASGANEKSAREDDAASPTARIENSSNNSPNNNNVNKAGGVPTQTPAIGAGVFIAPTDRAVHRVEEDLAKVRTLLGTLKDNLNGKKSLEVVDVEILRGIQHNLLEKNATNNSKGGHDHSEANSTPRGQRPKPSAHNNNDYYEGSSARGKHPTTAHSAITGNGDNVDAALRQILQQARESLGDVYNHYLTSNSNQQHKIPSPPSVGKAPRIDEATSPRFQGGGDIGTDRSARSGSKRSSSSHRMKMAQSSPALENGNGAAVDDLLSGRATVSTRSAKISKTTTASWAAPHPPPATTTTQQPPHQHHYHQQILHHKLVLPK